LQYGAGLTQAQLQLREPVELLRSLARVASLEAEHIEAVASAVNTLREAVLRSEVSAVSAQAGTPSNEFEHARLLKVHAMTSAREVIERFYRRVLS
jgi:hypothetical protein